jgi:hypothetical protein
MDVLSHEPDRHLEPAVRRVVRRAEYTHSEREGGRLGAAVRRQNPGDWTVANGALVCGGTQASWLSGDTVYSDFDLKLEFRGPEKMNSGVFLRSQKEGQPHITGYELQIWDYQPQGFLTGSLVNYQKATTPGKVIGDQWNTYDIKADGDHFVIALNGKTVLDAHDKARASGVIGLQCQPDNRIEFRNIKIRPIRK